MKLLSDNQLSEISSSATAGNFTTLTTETALLAQGFPQPIFDLPGLI